MSPHTDNTPLLPRLDTLAPTPITPIAALLDKAAILAGIQINAIDARPLPCYAVRRFGAVGDGITLDTAAIQRAIDTAFAAGGGTVYVHPGVYMCGGVELKSNVTLHLEAGAYLWGAEQRAEYAHPRGHLVYAVNARNIAVTGRGTLYGNAEALMDFPAIGEPHYLIRMPGEWRPERCVYFDGCQDLLLDGITIRDTPEWAVHLHRCERGRIHGVTVVNGLIHRVDRVANGDGIDIDTCIGIRVSDCYVQSSDDSICLKIEEYGEEQLSLCRDITITNCVVHTSQTAIKLGTGSFGEYRNIVISNCTIRDGAGGIGMWVRDGGLIDGVRIDNIVISQGSDQEHGTAFYFRGYRRNAATPRDGLIRNVSISNVTAVSHGALFMAGPEAKVFQDIEFRNIRFLLHGKVPRECAITPPVPFHPYAMSSTPYEFYVHHARNLHLANVSIAWDDDANPAWTYAMRFVGVDGLEIDGFRGKQGGDIDTPAILLHDVTDVWLRHCRADAGCGDFLGVEGNSRDIRITDSDLSRARSVAKLGDGGAGRCGEVTIYRKGAANQQKLSAPLRLCGSNNLSCRHATRRDAISTE